MEGGKEFGGGMKETEETPLKRKLLGNVGNWRSNQRGE